MAGRRERSTTKVADRAAVRKRGSAPKGKHAPKRAAARVSDTRGAERRLRETEELYDVAMRAINEGVYDWDLVHDTVKYSERVQHLLGLPAGTLSTPKDWDDRIHPDDKPRFNATLVAHFKGEADRFECDYRYRAVDGSWRWARQHGLAFRDARGRATRMIGSTGDITELKHAEEAFRESEERYALATTVATEGIYEWRVAVDDTLFISDRASEVFGIPPGISKGREWVARIHPEDLPGYRQAVVDHFKGRTPVLEHEYRVISPAGDYLWVRDRAIGVRDAGGRVVKLIGAEMDVTQTKRAELELRRAHEAASEALERQTATSDVLRAISASPTDTAPVFDAILQRVVGLCEAEVAALMLFDGERLHPVAGVNVVPELYEKLRRTELRPARWNPTLLAALERRTVHATDLLEFPDFRALTGGAMTRDDPWRTVLAVPLLREGVLAGVISAWRKEVRAFTDKQIELVSTFADQAVIAIENARLFHEIQEKSHQLEIANQHKSAFLANMSHELRTPLNAVIGFSEMLAARYFGELNEKQAEYVADIHASGRHLLSLINDILDLAKIEAGRTELEVSGFDLPEALGNALTLVRERAERGGVRLDVEVDPALGTFRGDERKVKQIALNLLSNAVKFTPRGGTVSVAAKRADGGAEIMVCDTGVGIAPADQEAIFEAFSQVGTDVTRKREGTGLGLALTRRFVELHGGTIRVESESGKGSTFTVTLPDRHGE